MEYLEDDESFTERMVGVFEELDNDPCYLLWLETMALSFNHTE